MNSTEAGGGVDLNDILGCWTLVEALEERDGQVGPNPNFGERPTGLLHYMSGQRMAVLVANGGRHRLSGMSRRSSPEAELAEAARTFDAYGGRFTLQGPDRIVHHIEISSYQNDVGADFVRHVSLSDGILRLEPPAFVETGETVRRWLLWRKIVA